MAKKIKFPLEVANGVKARSIEELRENFDVELIITYYKNGKLVTWLEDRYYDEEVEKIGELKILDVDFLKKLCETFDVEYVAEVNSEEIAKKAERVAKLKQYTEEVEIIQNIDKVAFDQEELADLLDEEEKKIYLCGEQFTIPLRIEAVEYIGINNPIIIIKSKERVDFEEKKIKFENIQFDNEYKMLINLEKVENEKKFKKYEVSNLLKYRLSGSMKIESEKIYEILSGIKDDCLNLNKQSRKIYELIDMKLQKSSVDLSKESNLILKEIEKIKYNENFIERFK